MKVIADVPEETRTIGWVSGGAASAVACWLMLKKCKELGLPPPRFVRIDPLSEHPDTERFVNEVSEKMLESPIETISIRTHGSAAYADCKSHFDVLEKAKAIRFSGGAPCTSVLKRKVRERFQTEEKLNSHVWGFCTGEEKRVAQMKKQVGYHHFPLIENGLSKQDCFDVIESFEIALPDMYLLGFNNNNCFVGSQRFLTKDGLKTLEECCGSEQEVLTREGWKKADISCFGIQEITKLSLQDPMTKEVTEILTTENHRWLVPRYTSVTQGEITVETKNLKIGVMVPRWSVHGRDFTDVSATEAFRLGVANGIVYGDGSKYSSAGGYLSKAYIDEDKAELNEFIMEVPRCPCKRPRTGSGASARRGTIHHGLPGSLKDLPDFRSVSEAYALGFIAGLIATDGNVNKGSVCVTNKDRAALLTVADALTSLGIMNCVKKERIRDTNYAKGAKLSSLVIGLRSIPEWMILRRFHKEKAVCKSGKEHRPKGMKVVAVEPAGYASLVYCATVKNGPAEFTLEGFIGTGNCLGCCKGGMGYWNHLRKVFPDVFDRMAKLERLIGHSCLKEQFTDADGERKTRKVFLDELDPERGIHEPMYVEDCGSSGEVCELQLSIGKTHFDEA